MDGGSFVDLAGDNGSTMLVPEPFTWLLNIRPGYHLFRREMECWIESYTPSWFARQFEYDQLYVGNPKSELTIQVHCLMVPGHGFIRLLVALGLRSPFRHHSQSWF